MPNGRAVPTVKALLTPLLGGGEGGSEEGGLLPSKGHQKGLVAFAVPM